MSSYVAAGAALPLVSWIFGPIGTFGSCGAGPRPDGTSWQIKVVLSCSQSQGSPIVALRRSLPLINLARPLAVSATHNSIRSSLRFWKERREPSGEKRTFKMFACGGTITFTFPPSRGFFYMIAYIFEEG